MDRKQKRGQGKAKEQENARATKNVEEGEEEEEVLKDKASNIIVNKSQGNASDLCCLLKTSIF